jgi:DNA mismatch repair protein MutS
VVNVHLDAVEHHGEIVFMHSVKTGPASRSYGLQVAQLAGIPRTVISRAQTRLAELEAGRNAVAAKPSRAERPEPVPQLSLFDDRPRKTLQKLAELVPDDTTPRDALALLYELKTLYDAERAALD